MNKFSFTMNLAIDYNIIMLKLTLDDVEFGTHDFGKTVTAKIFNEDNTAFNASAFTAKAKAFDIKGIQVIDDIDLTWTTQASGIGTFALTNTKTFASEGIFFIEVQLEQSGKKISTERKKVFVYASPS